MSDLIGHIHCMDALALLKQLPDDSIDLVVTSPPYNLRNSTGGGLKGHNDKGFWANQPMRYGYDTYTDDMPHDEYIQWQRSILVECLRVIDENGAIFYNHKWRVQDGLFQRLADDITRDLPVRQIIIWSRAGGINFNDNYFLPTYEVIYLIANEGFRLQPGCSTLKDVWHIPPLQGKEHPNAYPLELAERCISSASRKGGLILDPFMGSGTTAVAAQNLKRQYIGCDISEEYVAIAQQRLTDMPPDVVVAEGVIQVSLFQGEQS